MVLTTFVQTLLEFHNIIFLCFFGIAMLFMFLQVWGAFGDIADTDADADIDVETDVEIDIETDVETDVSDVDIEVDSDVDDASRVSGISKILSFFGIGRVPIGIWVFTFSLMIGLTGLVLNLILFEKDPSIPSESFIVIFLGSLLIAIYVTKYFCGLIALIMPRTTTHGIRSYIELLDKTGTIRFNMDINGKGYLMVIDDYNNIQNVECKLSEHHDYGELTELKQGTKVQLVDYNRDEKIYVVVPE